LAHDHPDQGVDEGQDRALLQSAWARLTVQPIHLPRGFALCRRGGDLRAPAVPLGEVGDTIDRRLEPRGHQRDLAGLEAWMAAVVAHLSGRSRLWLGRSCLPGESGGTELRFQPSDELVMAAECLTQAGLKMERYAKAAGITASCHSLRHTFASNLLEHGAEVVTIRDFLEHSQIASSECYAKVSNQKMKQEYMCPLQKILKQGQG
jgi:hypothetical protein